MLRLVCLELSVDGLTRSPNSELAPPLHNTRCRSVAAQMDSFRLLREDSVLGSNPYSGIFIEICAVASSVVSCNYGRGGSVSVPSVVFASALRGMFLCVVTVRQRTTVRCLSSSFMVMLVTVYYNIPCFTS